MLKSILLTLLFTTLLNATNQQLENKNNLTDKEIAYLKDKKNIIMCIDPNWLPFEAFDKNNKHIGITADYFNLFQKELPIKIKTIRTDTWDQSLEFARDKKCDILSLAMPTPKREEYLNFTSSYLMTPLVVATKYDKQFIDNFTTLTTQKFGITKGYAFGELLKVKYPNLNIIEVDNIEDGLNQVVDGKLFGYIGTLASVGYQFQKKFTGELKIAGKFDEKWNLGIAVRDDDKILLGIFEKLIESVDKSTKQTILNNWIAIDYKKGLDYSLVWQILIIGFILSLVFFYYQRKLSILNDSLKKRTKEIEDSLEDFEYLFNNTIETMGLFQDNICINLNEAGIKLFGFKNLEDAIGKSPIDFIAPKSIDTVRDYIKKGYMLPYEVNAIKQDGTIFPVLIKGQYKMINGKNTRITSLLDLTELKKKELQLQEFNNSLKDKIDKEVKKNRQKDTMIFQQNKLISMGEMIGNIAHQWRQPLASINNSVTLIDKKLKNNLSVEKDLDNIELTVQYMSKTIDDFQNFYKQDKEKVKFDIQDIINKTISIVSSSFKDSKITITNDNSNFSIFNYPNELQQVLLVLLNNARDFIEQNKIVDGIVEIKIKLDKNDDQLYIEIYNNGGNIKDEIIDKIFEPYFTTKHKTQGTGLGLYISKMIIEQSMDGELSVKNIDDSVCFKIVLNGGGEFKWITILFSHFQSSLLKMKIK